MKNLAFIFFLLLAKLVTPQSLKAQFTLPEDLVTEIESRIAGGHYVGISIGVFDSSGTYFYGFGKTDKKAGTKPDKNTLFEIGSISKVFTGILLADRVGEGRMKLDDPIEQYLPAHVKVPERAGDKIVLRQLSTHSSGLPRMPNNMNPEDPTNPFADYDSSLLYDFLSGYELPRDIGSKAEYSNLAVGLLGHIMEREAGTSYENLLIERICNPLGLSDTRITLNKAQQIRFATPYSLGLQNHSWDFDCLAACGAIRSSAADMLKFLKANADLENSLGWAMALSQRVHGEQKLGEARMGLGWLLVRGEDSTRAMLHDGATGGYRAFAAVVPSQNYGFIVLSNATANVGDLGFRLLKDDFSLQQMEPTLPAVLIQEIDEKGFRKGRKLYKKLRKEDAKAYSFTANAFNKVGEHYLEMEAYELAEKILANNKKRYPDNPHTLFLLGEAARMQGKAAEAESYYRQCLDIRKNYSKALDRLTEMGIDVSTSESN